MDPNDGAPLTESVTACETALADLQRLGRHRRRRRTAR